MQGQWLSLLIVGVFGFALAAAYYLAVARLLVQFDRRVAERDEQLHQRLLERDEKLLLKSLLPTCKLYTRA